jgi:hypothetical protein
MRPVFRAAVASAWILSGLLVSRGLAADDWATVTEDDR